MKDKGFTFIEVLVVVAIIGILSAIAIPQFEEYRARGFDARAKSDLRNVATAEEAYFVDNEKYVACPDAQSCTNVLPGITSISNGVTISIVLNNDGFYGKAYHKDGTGARFCWDSHRGGLIDCQN